MNQSKKILFSFIVVSISILVVFALFGSFESFTENLLSAYSTEPLKYLVSSFVILASDVIMPVPSTIVMYLNGYVLGVVQGALLSWVSLMLSSILAYVIGRYNPWSRVQVGADDTLLKVGPYAIIVTRCIPVLAETISILGGIIHYPFKKFIIYHGIGYVPICVLFSYFGTYAMVNNQFVLALGISVGVTVLLWAAGYFLRLY